MSTPGGFPKGFPGLDFASCVEVTFVLRDFQVLTGRIRGVLGDRFDWNYYSKDKDCDSFKKEPKHPEPPKCCEPTKVEIEVEEESKFILLELTRPAAAVNLSEFLCFDTMASGIDLTVSGTTFPIGSCVAINVENIIYAGPGAVFCDIPIYIGAGAEGGLSISLKK
ncbi:MAG TPA: hypothetical protein VN521_05140 [Negativicutes bacterium]|nr:hypothetical protein [Negativicutes bacterium]